MFLGVHIYIFLSPEMYIEYFGNITIFNLPTWCSTSLKEVLMSKWNDIAFVQQ